jgi:hypothetical protein
VRTFRKSTWLEYYSLLNLIEIIFTTRPMYVHNPVTSSEFFFFTDNRLPPSYHLRNIGMITRWYRRDRLAVHQGIIPLLTWVGTRLPMWTRVPAIPRLIKPWLSTVVTLHSTPYDTHSVTNLKQNVSSRNNKLNNMIVSLKKMTTHMYWLSYQWGN